MAGTLYVDFLSQPSRACIIFCRLNSLPVNPKLVRVDKQEQRSPDYLALNPIGKVPFYVDSDVQLPESGAILQYLARKHNVPDHWYPKQLVPKAKVDAAMHWFHTTIRAGCMKYVFNLVLGKSLGLHKQGNPAIVADSLQTIKAAFGIMESYWLKSTPFMAGSQISLADLLVACEITQLKFANAAPGNPGFEELLNPYATLRSWLERVESTCGDVFQEVHSTMDKAVARAVEKSHAAQPAPKL